jgi:hypothetical protein
VVEEATAESCWKVDRTVRNISSSKEKVFYSANEKNKNQNNNDDKKQLLEKMKQIQKEQK